MTETTAPLTFWQPPGCPYLNPVGIFCPNCDCGAVPSGVQKVSDSLSKTPDPARDERMVRAECFVRECLQIMGQSRDASDGPKVREIAQRVLKAMS